MLNQYNFIHLLDYCETLETIIQKTLLIRIEWKPYFLPILGNEI